MPEIKRQYLDEKPSKEKRKEIENQLMNEYLEDNNLIALNKHKRGKVIYLVVQDEKTKEIFGLKTLTHFYCFFHIAVQLTICTDKDQVSNRQFNLKELSMMTDSDNTKDFRERSSNLMHVTRKFVNDQFLELKYVKTKKTKLKIGSIVKFDKPVSFKCGTSEEILKYMGKNTFVPLKETNSNIRYIIHDLKYRNYEIVG